MTDTIDAVAQARREVIHHFTGNPDDEYDSDCEVLTRFAEAVRADECARYEELVAAARRAILFFGTYHDIGRDLANALSRLERTPEVTDRG